MGFSAFPGSFAWVSELVPQPSQPLKEKQIEDITIQLHFVEYKLEIVITRAAPAFDKLFMVMGCVFDINTAHKTVEKLPFQAFY